VTRRRDDLAIGPTIIRLAQQGDRAATATLLRKMQDSLYRFCLLQLRHPDRAWDATQETALRMLQRLDTFNNRSQLRTWAFGIALNVCREMHRSPTPGSMPIVESPDTSTCPLGTLLASERQHRLHEALDTLTDRQRALITMRYFEEMPAAEIAEAMGIATGTVKATLFQTLRRLRRDWEAS